jgi:hypothetical protein
VHIDLNTAKTMPLANVLQMKAFLWNWCAFSDSIVRFCTNLAMFLVESDQQFFKIKAG